MTNDFSDRLRHFVCGWETCVLRAFWDGAQAEGGARIWTIGWGHTKGVREGDVCSQHEADMWLLDDLEDCAETVRRLVDQPLTQNQFDALVSFVYNFGEPKFAGSTLRKMVDGGNHTRAALELLRWNKHLNKVQRGLLARRCGEALMYEFADYTGF